MTSILMGSMGGSAAAGETASTAVATTTSAAPRRDLQPTVAVWQFLGLTRAWPAVLQVEGVELRVVA